AATLAGALDDGAPDWPPEGPALAALHARLDYEGLDGALHAHKLAAAQTLLRLCQRLGCPLLVLDATRLAESSQDFARIVADLRKLSMLAVPLGLRIAWRAHPGAAHARDFMTAADVIQAAERPNLGLALDVHEWLRADADLALLEGVDPQAIFQVQLADSGLAELPAAGLADAQRLFPGEGRHATALRQLVARLARAGFAGHFAFADVRGDVDELPSAACAARAAASARHLALDVLRRSQPLTVRRRRTAPEGISPAS
ncbi:MAG: TIM barrel protein, partial [Comamonas sp.]